MGLNSLFELLINMRYYTDKDIPNNWSQMLIKQLTETQKEQWILTHEGLYKYINNVLHKFKVGLSEDEPPNIETKSIIKPSNINWVKFDTLYNIPIKHKVLDIKIYSYKKTDIVFFPISIILRVLKHLIIIHCLKILIRSYLYLSNL